MSTVAREKLKLLSKRLLSVTKQLFQNPMGAVGVVILVAFMVLGAFGAAMAPFSVPIGGYDERFGKHTLPFELGPTETVRLSPGGYAEVQADFVEKPDWPGLDPNRYGLLRVTTTPEVATTIFVDGEWRSMTSLDWLKIAPDDYTVSFSDVPGYVTPADVAVVVVKGATVTEVAAEFVPTGRLQVTTEPAVPSTIYVDGIPRGERGLSVNIAPGSYNVSFGPVEGYIPPEPQTVNVTSGGLVEITGIFTPSPGAPGPDPSSYGLLRVTTTPALPSMIHVQQNWASEWSLEWLKLRPGRYNLSFSDIPGYVTQSAYEVTIVAGEVTTFEAEFKQCALLKASTVPAIPSTIYVNGVARNDWRVMAYVPEGTYHVTFRTCEGYATPPSSVAVTLSETLPYLASAGAALVVLRAFAKGPHGSFRRPLLPIVAAAAAASTALLAVVLAEKAGIFPSGIPEWFYPASMLGVAASFVSLGLMHSVLDRDIKIAVGIAILVPLPLVVPMFVELDPFATASLLLSAYTASGIMVAVSAARLRVSFKRAATAFAASGISGEDISTKLMRMSKAFGVLLSSGAILTGILIYLVQNWSPHWMGTDVFGYDVLSELMYGARTSIIVGVFAAAIASFLGAAVGLYSGYVGGWKDEVVMRLNDIVLSIPWLVLMIIVAAMLGKIDLTGIILIIGLTGWSFTARMVRAQVLSVKERQYIERARAIGASELHIIKKHIFPNTFPLVFANTILTVAVSILSEATLSFLGMRPVGVVTWGTMLSFAHENNAFAIGLHGWILAPGLCIVAVVLGFTLVGYALDDILNPKLRKR